MTAEVKRKLFGMCRAGLHDECIVGFEMTKTVDGIVLPAERCSCDCGHTVQQEREGEK